MKLLIIILLNIFPLYAQITLEEAWLKVQHNNDGLKASNSDLQRAQLIRQSAKSMYLPSISLSATYSYLDKPVNLDISNFSTTANEILTSLGATASVPSELDLTDQNVFLADLHLLWPLYTGGKIDAAQEIYASKVDESKALQEMKKDKEFLKLVQYYYGVIVSEALYKTRVESQKALELHYENAKHLKEQGQIANIELLNAEVKLDNAKIETTKSRHNLQIAISAFYSLTKQKDKPTSKLFVNERIEDEEYYKTQTQENNLGLKILDAKEKESNSFVSIKESAWYPQVTAYANYNIYKDDSAIMSTLPTWFAGVIVKIDLLQRVDRSQEVQAAKLLNSKVNYLKDEALEHLALLVEKTYKEIVSAKEEFNALDSSIKLAQENYRLRNIAFSEGLSTSVELIDAQMFLLSIQTKRLNAAYNYVQKLSQLCVLSGDRDKLFEIAQISQEIK